MAKRRVAVIGSGFGGLAAAIRLQAQGFEVTIFEKRDKPGGRAYVYEMNGFRFDAGPTVITDPECLAELFQCAGREIEDYVKLVPVEPFYKLLWEDGTEFEYGGDLEKTVSQIRRMAPDDVDGYLKFLDYSREVYNEGYIKLGAVPFLSWWRMVSVSPQLARLRADRTVYDTVAKYIKNERLREAFSFHSLLVGGNPFSTSAIYTLIHYLERKGGVHFPIGGTGALINGLLRLFTDIGGTIRLNCPVERVACEGESVRGVEIQGGQFEPADLVVSNGDVVHTYRDLLGHKAQGAQAGRQAAKSRHSMSLFLIYFGTQTQYPNLAHHNVIFGPRYRDLLTDIFQRGVLAEDFSLYLHRPTATDSSLAPAGHDSFYVLSPVPHLGKWKGDWSKEGPKYAERILQYLEGRYMPGLSQSLVAQKVFTPDDFRIELNAHHGSAFSLEPILTQSAYFRTHNRDKTFKGLYFVGAGTHPGAGIPGVVASAKATAGLVVRDFGVGRVS